MMTQPEVESLLEPHVGRLYQAITSGLADYSAYPPTIRQCHTPRTRASARHDHIVKRITESFDSVPGVVLLELRGLFLLLIESRVAIRFNKLSDDGRFHGNSTGQASLFQNQQPLPQQEELPGIPAHSLHLIAGYSLDELGLAAADISLGCPSGEQFLWQIRLTPSVAAVVPINTGRVEPQSTEKARQVRPRASHKLAKADEDDSDG
jgi:hypothetical protein